MLPQGTEQEQFRHKCIDFKHHGADTTIEFTEIINSYSKASLQYRDKTCGASRLSNPVLYDTCRVAIYVRTSHRSGVHAELWLPNHWNGRFLAIGNGGLNGCLDYANAVYAANQGFAAITSNNGHNGTSGLPFFMNSDVVEDFAGRSLHTITTVGKLISRQFYGSSPQKSYFLGCSQGGRQGIGAAEKYPDDFDGIVAGSPALDFNNLISWRASFYPLTGPASSPSFIDMRTWSELIHNSILEHCDEIDGVKDGIIEYPEFCKYDPRVLQCNAEEHQDCLTEFQVDIVRRFFLPLNYKDGTEVYPGMLPGSEIRAAKGLYAGKAYANSEDWFKYVVYNDLSWNSASFAVDKDAKASADLNPFNIRTFPSQLNSFRAHGGKIIAYHGMQDQQITAFITSKWYNHLLKTYSHSDLDKFLRYFRISGMNHCNSGPGAWMIGQSQTPITTVKTNDIPYKPSHNVLAAIVDWVEHGNAPDTIEGTKFTDDNPSKAIEFSRKHCRFPQRNTFVGSALDGRSGETSAKDWVCS